jgi:hypothetical protein
VADDVGPQARVIDVADVAALGSVDAALAQFYDEAVSSAATASGTGEREIREWFDGQLLTEQGVRTQALVGPGERPDDVLRALEDAHVIRAETRRGAHWYELAHDRLVAPVRDSNAAWRGAHLGTLQLDATTWARQGRPPELLAAGDRLAAAHTWADAHPDQLITVDRDFLAASDDNEHKLLAVSRASRRVLLFGVVAAVLAVLAAVGSVVALELKSARDDARRQQRAAEANESRANTNAAEAAKQQQIAQSEAQAAANAASQAADDAAQKKLAAEAAGNSAAEAIGQRNAAAAAQAAAEQQQQAAQAAADEATRQKALADAAAAEAKNQAARANAAAAVSARQRDRARTEETTLECLNKQIKTLDAWYEEALGTGLYKLISEEIGRADALVAAGFTPDDALEYLHDVARFKGLSTNRYFIPPTTAPC